MSRRVEDIPNEVFEVVASLLLSVLLPGLAALLLWPLGHAPIALQVAKGCGIFWIVVTVTAIVLARIQDRFKINIYDHGDAFLGSNLLVSAFLTAGWAAFAALTVHIALGAGASIGTTVLVFLAAGLPAALIGYVVVAALWQGHLYKIVNLALGFAALLLFALWPAAARAAFGWFFRLF